MNPYAFLVGCPRSGTTLLGRIVNAHDQMAVIHESRWIADIYLNRLGLTADGRVTQELAEVLSDPKRLKPLAMDSRDIAQIVERQRGAPFGAFVSALFDAYGERHDCRLVGDKTPGYVRYLPLLHGLWPDSRFVHIVRDGRAVWLSVRDWGKGASGFSVFEEDPVRTAAVWWEWYVRLGREAGRDIATIRYHELQYEALVSEPEEACRSLCRFLDLPFDSTMLRFHEGRTNLKPGLSTKSAWLPVTAGLRDWRAQLDRDEKERFESAAAGLLEELGYPLASSTIAQPSRDRAAAVREQFVEQLLERGRPVPLAWHAPMAAHGVDHKGQGRVITRVPASEQLAATDGRAG